MKRIKKILCTLFCTLFLTGCSWLDDNSMNDISVYTTIYPYNYLISYLYGNNSKINSIYPKGVNIGKYKISDKKINEYSKSELFVFSSLDEEEREIAAKMINNNKELKLIDVSMGMSINNNIEESWLNPYNYLMMAKNVKAGLNEYIDNKLLNDAINSSYEELKYEISNLDASIKEMINNKNYDTIITDNDGLKFLEKYELNVIILKKENVEEIKSLINEGKIKYLFSLNQLNKEDELVKDLTIEIINLNSMKSVDGLTESSNDDYFSIMTQNIELINKELEK